MVHLFYSHINYSVTKIRSESDTRRNRFYSHVNYSVTKIYGALAMLSSGFTVT